MGKFDRNSGVVQIFDTTNRDGEQATLGAKYGDDSKLEIAQLLADAGFDRIEAGFAASSEGDFRSVQKVAQTVEGPMIFSLARVPIYGKNNIVPDIGIAYDAVQDSQNPGIHTFSTMFDPVSLENYGVTTEQVVEGAAKGVDEAQSLLKGRGQVEFSFQNAFSAPLEDMIKGYKKVVEAGANVINVPDTVGIMEPDDVYERISILRSEVPDSVLISMHCHNDLGLAVANSLAGVKAGADIVEGTINGIGERAGNTALEEVIMAIKLKPEKYQGRDTRIDTTKLGPLSKLVSHHYSMPVPENKAVVGSNAFRHRSGIHQDGMQKGGVYEIMNPKDVGWNGETYDLTARSGVAGVSHRLNRLGYNMDRPEVKDRIMPEFKALADEKGSIDDADLVHLVDSTNPNFKSDYSLVGLNVNGTDGNYEAKVTIFVKGREKTSTEKHEGAISAIYTAIDNIVGKPEGMHMVYSDPKPLGTSRHAIAEATVILSRDQDFKGMIRPFDGMYVGRARHQDTLHSSAMAYLNALEKAKR